MAELTLDVRPLRPYTRRALALASMLDHPSHDCFYLAVAESADVSLVTADRRFVAALRRADWRGVDVRILAALA
jgi:predicted nucleic acid-binding protein